MKGFEEMRTFSREFSAVQLLHAAANSYGSIFSCEDCGELLKCYDHIIWGHILFHTVSSISGKLRDARLLEFSKGAQETCAI